MLKFGRVGVRTVRLSFWLLDHVLNPRSRASLVEVTIRISSQRLISLSRRGPSLTNGGPVPCERMRCSVGCDRPVNSEVLCGVRSSAIKELSVLFCEPVDVNNSPRDDVIVTDGT